MAEATASAFKSEYTPKLDHYQEGSSIRMSWQGRALAPDEHYQVVVEHLDGSVWKRVFERDVGKGTSCSYRFEEPGSYGLNVLLFRGQTRIGGYWLGQTSVVPVVSTRWAVAAGCWVVLALLAILGVRSLRRRYVEGWRIGPWLHAAGSWSRRHVLFYCILGVCVALRAAVSFSMEPHLTGDAIDYWAATTQYYYAVHAVLVGDFRTAGHLFPYPYYPPGLPFLLLPVRWFLGLDFGVLHLLNVLWDTVAIVFTFLIGSRLFGQRTGYLAMAAMGLYPATINMDFMLFPEQPYTALLMIIVWLLICRRVELRSARQLLGIGILLGVLIVVRTFAVLVPILLGVYLLALKSQRGFTLRKAMATWLFLLVGVAVPLVPLTAANAVRFHEFIVGSNKNGVQLWHGNNPKANGAYNPLFETENPFGGLSYAARNKLGYQLTIDFVRHHPGWFVAMAPVKIRSAFWDDGNYISTWPYRRSDGRDQWVFSVWSGPTPRAYHIALLFLATFGFVWLFVLAVRRKVAPEVWLLILIIGYYLFVIVVYFGNPKFVTPIIPIMSIFTAAPLRRPVALP
jgi:4-amino-4-deoxy-L-arabinose transferase-like glycosyltransferase